MYWQQLNSLYCKHQKNLDTWKNVVIIIKCEYCKTLKNSDTRKFAVITLKVEQGGFTIELCIQKMQRELQTV